MIKRSSFSFRSLKKGLLEKLTILLGKQGLSMDSYSDLDSPIDQYTFSADGGRLGSIIHVKGLRKYAMTNSYKEMLDQLAIELSSFFRYEKHMLQATYTFDSSAESVERKLRELQNPSIKSMRAIGLELDDIVDANIKNMALKYGVVTDLVLCVWTLPVGKQNTPTAIFPYDSEKSASGVHSSSVLDAHTSLVRKIVHVLGTLDIDASLLNIDKALLGIRQRLNPTIKGHWSPSTEIGDVGFRQDSGDDALRFVPDKLNRQVTPGYVEIPNFNDLYINDKLMVKSFDALHFPRQTVTFENLLNLFASADAPVRLTYTIIGGGNSLGKFKLNSALSYLSTNSSRKSAIRFLKDAVNDQNVIVGMQLSASTWVYVPEGITAAKNDKERFRKLNRVLERNFEKISTCFSNWGEAEPDLKNDTPMYAWCRNNAGFKSTSDSHLTFAPIIDAFRLLPFFKMSPIWTKYGMKVMRTPQNELIPINRLAGNQNYTFQILFGRPRSGKSVKMAGDVLAMCMFPGIRELPFISYIDVGMTIWGTMELIRDALPEAKKHQVTTYQMENSPEHAINPFHLPMGLRRPSSQKRDFLINFLKMLVTDPEQGTREGVEGVIARLIESTYKYYDDTIDNSHPKPYGENVNSKLDLWLKNDNYNYQDGRTTFWDLFEYFYEQQDYKKAHLCQAYASPILPDFISVLDKPEFTNAYQNDPESMQICKYMSRTLSDCLNLYPILSKESLLNMDETRLLALELGKVAQAGMGGVKTTAIMYFIAIDLSIRNFFQSEEDIKEIPEKYQPYHNEKFQKTKSLPKSLNIDELHKATGGDIDLPIARQTRNQLVDLVRVFVKKNIEFAVASQMLADFTEDLLELANNRIILSTSANSEDEVIRKFKLDPSMKVVLPNLGKPSKDGSMMLIQTETNDGNYTHVVYNTVSPIEIWAQVSNEIDKLVRDGAYKHLPKKVARMALAKLFPGCTAKSAAVDLGGDIDDMSNDKKVDVADKIISQVVREGKKIMASL